MARLWVSGLFGFFLFPLAALFLELLGIYAGAMFAGEAVGLFMLAGNASAVVVCLVMGWLRERWGISFSMVGARELPRDRLRAFVRCVRTKRTTWRETDDNLGGHHGWHLRQG